MHRERRGPGEDEDEVYPSGHSGRASVKARCGCQDEFKGTEVLIMGEKEVGYKTTHAH